MYILQHSTTLDSSDGSGPRPARARARSPGSKARPELDFLGPDPSLIIIKSSHLSVTGIDLKRLIYNCDMKISFNFRFTLGGVFLIIILVFRQSFVYSHDCVTQTKIVQRRDKNKLTHHGIIITRDQSHVYFYQIKTFKNNKKSWPKRLNFPKFF